MKTIASDIKLSNFVTSNVSISGASSIDLSKIKDVMQVKTPPFVRYADEEIGSIDALDSLIIIHKSAQSFSNYLSSILDTRLSTQDEINALVRLLALQGFIKPKKVASIINSIYKNPDHLFSLLDIVSGEYGQNFLADFKAMVEKDGGKLRTRGWYQECLAKSSKIAPYILNATLLESHFNEKSPKLSVTYGKMLVPGTKKHRFISNDFNKNMHVHEIVVESEDDVLMQEAQAFADFHYEPKHAGIAKFIRPKAKTLFDNLKEYQNGLIDMANAHGGTVVKSVDTAIDTAIDHFDYDFHNHILPRRNLIADEPKR